MTEPDISFPTFQVAYHIGYHIFRENKFFYQSKLKYEYSELFIITLQGQESSSSSSNTLIHHHHCHWSTTCQPVSPHHSYTQCHTGRGLCTIGSWTSINQINLYSAYILSGPSSEAHKSLA